MTNLGCIVSLFDEIFCTKHFFLKSDLLPYWWKPVKYQNAVLATCYKKVQLKQRSLTNLTETTIVSECIFKMACHCENCKKSEIWCKQEKLLKNSWAILLLLFILRLWEDTSKNNKCMKKYNYIYKIW